MAVAGHPADRDVFYFGSTGGGVWMTENAGQTWQNVSDGYFKRASVGALAVAASDPNVVYAGMGESCIRGNVSHGDGVYRSTDGGQTWAHRGLKVTRHIGRVRVHPQDPDLVYVAALGHAHGPNPERGVYRSKDGGASWDLVLHRSADAGAVDLALDPFNPRVIYATTWETRRLPWHLNSGGPGSGIFKSTDGGDTWTEISHARGLPKGSLGRVGITASPARRDRIWAVVEAADGAIFRSDDGGTSWVRLSEQADLRFRAWYYQHIYADPVDPETIWALNIEMWRSVDGGRNFEKWPIRGGDCHDLWIDPQNPRRMILGNDGGAEVTLDGGATWSTRYNQPTAEMYNVVCDDHEPYRLYGAQQDSGSLALPSRTDRGLITPADYFLPGGGESGHFAVRQDDPDVVYGASYGGYLTRYDGKTKVTRRIDVWPEPVVSQAAKDARHRFQWTFPVVVSPHDPNTLYVAAERVFRTLDDGHSWEAISPDLTHNDAEKLGLSGGEFTPDNTTAEYYCTVFALAESPLRAGLIWAGTDDGRLHVTDDAGLNWREVTPPDLPEWTLVSTLEPSRHDAATCFVAASRAKLDDFEPYLFVTRDLGASWSRIDGGLPRELTSRVLRQDRTRPELLFAGVEAGIYASFDAGGTWASLQGDLPVTPVHDLQVHRDDLVVATHGRGFWVLDDMTPLRALTPAPLTDARLFPPRAAVRRPGGRVFSRDPRPGTNWFSTAVGNFAYEMKPDPAQPGEKRRVLLDSAENPPYGLLVQYALPELADDTPVRLTFAAEDGTEIRSLSAKLEGEDEPKALPGVPRDPRIPRRAGLNRFVWDLCHPPAQHIEKSPPESQALGGPPVPPGRYVVELRVGDGQPLRETFEVAIDPSLNADADGVRRQYALSLQLWELLSRANRAVTTIRGLKEQLERWTAKDAPEESLRESATKLAEALCEVEKELVVVKPKGSEWLENPPALTYKLGVAMAASALDVGPTESAEAYATELVRQTHDQLARLDAILESDLKAFNAQVAASGQAAVSPPGPPMERVGA